MSHEHHDYRGYAGQVASGIFRPGDEVVVLPSGFTTTIAGIDEFGGPIDEAFAADVGERAPRRRHRREPRRHALPAATTCPTVTQDVDAMVCWFSEQPLRAGATYAMKHTTRTAKARVQDAALPPRREHAAPRRRRRRARAQRPRAGHAAHRGAAVRRRVPPQPRSPGASSSIDEGTFETVGAGMMLGAVGLSRPDRR